MSVIGVLKKWLLITVACLLIAFSMTGNQEAGATVIYIGSSTPHTNHSNGGVTRINWYNPSAYDGTITSVTIELTNSVTGLRIFIAYNTGGYKFKVRSSYYIGSATSGFHTYAVTLDVRASDCIGFYGEGTNTPLGTYSVSPNNYRCMYYVGECSDVGDEATFASNLYMPCVYGSGTTGIGIASADAVLKASIGTLDGVAKSALKSIDGIQ